MGESKVIQTAREFSRLLYESLGASTMGKVIARNRRDPSTYGGEFDRTKGLRGCNVCHTHDFLDANEVMAEAFYHVYGREFNTPSVKDDPKFNRAWTIAKTFDFHVPVHVPRKLPVWVGSPFWVPKRPRAKV